MKVGIHLRGLGGGNEVRGIGVHTSELLRELKLITYNSKLIIEEYNPKEKYDLVHYTVFKPFSFSIPFQKPAKKVVLTIHDLIPLIYPKHYPGGIKGSLVFLIQKFLVKINVDAIITISETSKKDICRFLNIDPSKVHVIYLAPKEVFKRIADSEKRIVKEKFKLPDKFALYVGDVNYNKNIPNLIKACEIAKIELVMVGKQAAEIEKEDLNHPELIHLKGLDFSKVIRLGFIPDEDLAVIYNLATVFVQLSLYEGFGLPVLEAIACGCPVVASKTQALVEIAEGAVAFVDPKNPEDIAKAIKNPQARQVKLPRGYCWENSARETIEVYAKV